MDIPKIILLDKIQKGLGNEIDENDVKKLQKEKLIEGRKPNYILSMKVAEMLDKKADYINKKGASNAEIETKILKLLEAFPSGARRRDIDEVCYHMLSTTLSSEQKDKKISNILNVLSKKNIIKNFGNDRNSLWKLIKITTKNK